MHIRFVGLALACLVFATPSFAIDTDNGNPPYGVLAAGTDTTDNGARVSVGTGAGDTMDEAMQHALAKCEEGESFSCIVAGSFSNGGCGFITNGSGNDSEGLAHVAWGAGQTKQAAYDKCQEVGFGDVQCDTEVIGFCSGRPIE